MQMPLRLPSPLTLVLSLVPAFMFPAIPACLSGQLCSLDLFGSCWSGGFPKTRSAQQLLCILLY